MQHAFVSRPAALQGAAFVAAGLLLGSASVALGIKSLALVAAAVAVAFMAIHPAGSLYMMVATIPMALDFGGGLTVTRITAPLALVLVFINAATRRCPWPRLLQWPEGVLAAAFIGMVLVSVSYAPDKALAVTELGPCAVLAALFYLTLTFTRDPRDLDRLAWILVAVALVEMLVTLAQVHYRFVMPGSWRPAALENIDVTSKGFRAEGTTAHPIFLAGFFQMALPFFFLLLWRTRHTWLRVGLVLSVPLVLYAWKSAYARSSMIGMAAMLLAAMALSSRIGRIAVLVGSAAGAALLAAYGFSVEDIIRDVDSIEVLHEMFKGADLYGSVDSFRFRIESWAGGFNLFLAHPWTGVGIGQAVTSYMPYLPGWAQSPAHPTEIHNVFIEAACELGVLALAALVGLWVLAFASLRRALRDPRLRAYAQTLLVVLVGQLAFLTFTPMVRDIWFTLPLAIALGRMARTGNTETARPVGEPAGANA